MLEIRAMTLADYDQAMHFWQQNPELGVSPAFDSRARIGAYLQRNPGLSTVAVLDGKVIGTVLCGHDGRRGSFYHVGVDPAHRGEAIATRMLQRSTNLLKEADITTAFLFTSNSEAAAFWQHLGWTPAPQILYHGKSL